MGGKIGELKAGLRADFAVVSLDGVHQIPSYGPTETLILHPQVVITMTVARKEVYRDGRVMMSMRIGCARECVRLR